ncbi:hypothetical protein CH376_12850 [Leptospira adleri]|uniref:Uncharacterized protein n=1 Tax=Leptospira adleri TaxID=2023186 RepID=A0ABX4NXR3_9LEPT|nr:hypothetical protein CH376_12850 [Leptospira adleri]
MDGGSLPLAAAAKRLTLPPLRATSLQFNARTQNAIRKNEFGPGYNKLRLKRRSSHTARDAEGSV